LVGAFGMAFLCLAAVFLIRGDSQFLKVVFGGLALAILSLVWLSRPYTGLHAWLALMGIQVPGGFIIERFDLGDLTLLPVFIGVLLLSRRIRIRRTSLDFWFICLVLVFAMGNLVSAIRLGYIDRAALVNKDIGLVVLLFCFYLPVWLIQSVRQLETAVRWFVLVNSAINAVMVCLGLFSLATGLPVPFMNGDRLVGLLLNPNAYGGFVAVLLALQLSLVLGKSPLLGIPKQVQNANCIFLLLGVVLTVSRSSWIACAVMMLVLIARYVSPRAAISVAVLASVLYLIPTYLIPRQTVQGEIQQAQDMTTLQSRFDINRVALDMWDESPATMTLGIGLGAFYALTGTSGLGYAAIVHNSYLWVLVEMGIVGAAVLLGLLWRVLRNVLRALKHSGPYQPLAWGVAAGIAGFLVWNLANEGMYQRHLWLLFALSEILARISVVVHLSAPRPQPVVARRA
jgi:O-antigen ligase